MGFNSGFKGLNWVYIISNLKHRTSGSAPDSAG